MENITGIVLAGGKSSRFGQDKGLFNYRGKPLVLHASEIIKPICNEIFISTNSPHDYAFTGIPTIVDIHKDCGPISGIHSGLHHAFNNKVVFIGCDMPFIPLELMQHLIQQLDTCQAAVPQHNGFKETLCLAINKSALESARKTIQIKKYKILDLLEMVNTCFTEVSQMPFYSPKIFTNINYKTDIKPED